MANYNASSTKRTVPHTTVPRRNCVIGKPERWLLANGVEPDRYAERSDTNSSACRAQVLLKRTEAGRPSIGLTQTIEAQIQGYSAISNLAVSQDPEPRPRPAHHGVPEATRL